ncbi:DUF6894 family protein [Sinorhizobium meliloti]
MSRYFFNIYNPRQSPDDIGTDCAGVADVRAEAVGTMRELARGDLLEHGDLSSMTINVVDGNGRTVMIVSLAASVTTVIGSSLGPASVKET